MFQISRLRWLQRVALGLAAAFGAALVASGGAFAWRMNAPAPEIARPGGQGCVEILVWSNGFHTGLIVPAAALPANHPARRLLPGHAYYVFGWGDEAFYRSDGSNFWLGVAALLPPSPAVVEILPLDAPPELAFAGQLTGPIGVSAAGAAGLASYLEGAMAPDADGEIRLQGKGVHPWQGWFVPAREQFHAFNVCNHWTARALRAAGLPVSDLGAWSAAGVTRQLARAPRCPP